MTEHTYWDELAAGFALHGLSDDEEILFIDHLATCEECAASLRDHEMVAAQLGSIAHYRDDSAAPSWESLRSAIVGSPQDERPADQPVDELAKRRRRYEFSRRTLAAAAAVVIVVGGGVAVWQGTTGGSTCSASGGCHSIELDAEGGTTAASLMIQGDTISMDTSGMAAAPSHRVYILWQERPDGGPTALKRFTASQGGAVTARLREPYSDTSGFAVSLESSGTTPAMPSNVIASGVTT